MLPSAAMSLAVILVNGLSVRNGMRRLGGRPVRTRMRPQTAEKAEMRSRTRASTASAASGFNMSMSRAGVNLHRMPVLRDAARDCQLVISVSLALDLVGQPSK